MNKFKTRLLILSGVNLALLLLVLAGFIFSPARRNSRSMSINLPKDKSMVSSIEISGPLSVQLLKDGDGWISVRSGVKLPASARRIDAMLDLLFQTGKVETAARSRLSWSELGLADSDTISLRLIDNNGKSIASLLLGYYTSTGGRAYMAMMEDDRAFIVPGGIASYLRSQETAWLELSVLLPSPRLDEIQSFSVRGSLPDGEASIDYNYSMIRSSASWMESGSGSLMDGVKVEAMLRQLSTMQAADIVADRMDTGATLCTVTLDLADGTELVLEISEQDSEGRYFARLNSRAGLVFMLPGYSVKDALKTRVQLLAESAP